MVIEDSADTVSYTEETDVSTTSFYASHVITAGGQGEWLCSTIKNMLNALYNTEIGEEWVMTPKIWMTVLITKWTEFLMIINFYMVY
jgi:alcohol dehydrogenase YqhD (iron-dependent ADH family)